MSKMLPLLLGMIAAVLYPVAGVAQYDIVLLGGRVMDPESGLDAIRNVGILGGRIAAIGDEVVAGSEIIDVSGHVVAPGFIDLNAHGQDPFSRDLQVRDGVTTALELESGVWPVGDWYAAREGRWRIDFGATVAYSNARLRAFGGDWDARTYRSASPEEIEAMEHTVAEGIDQGALGVGLLLGYMPGASREEILRLFQTAAEAGVTVFAHIRYGGLIEPESNIAALQEIIADAVASNGSVHIVHIAATGLTRVSVLLEMIDAAQSHGVDVSADVYPYTAGSTSIQSAIFDEGWQARLGADYGDIEWVATGERLDSLSFQQRRREGGAVLAHVIPASAMRYAIEHPGVMIASDGLEYVNGRAHPRGAGTFARVLGRQVREEGTIPLMNALRKITLMPAQLLEKTVPSMRRKGRVAIGADADLTVFDPNSVLDRATFADPALPSLGIPYVIVNGQLVVRDGELVSGAFPGRAIRRDPDRTP